MTNRLCVGQAGCMLWLALLSPVASAECTSAHIDEALLHGHATTTLHRLWSNDGCSRALMADRGLGAPSLLRGDDPPSDGTLGVRDSFRDSYPDVVETEHFAIKWGQMRGYTREDLEALGDELENAWDLQMGHFSFAGPPGTHAHKLNVYIGGSAADLPSDLGAAGYFWYDDEGYGMLVISEHYIDDRAYAASIAAHELFHGVQATAAVWDFAEDDSWFLEASAVFMQHRTYPDGVHHAELFPGFAYLPQLPLNAYDYPDSGITEEYHQYGAYVWVEHLWEHHGGDELIVALFAPEGLGLTPLERTAELIDDVPGAIFALHERIATLDFTDRDAQLAAVNAWGGWSSERSQRPTGATFGETDGFIPSAGPGDGGLTLWQLRLPPSELEVSVRLPEGPLWHAAVVSRRGTTHDVVPFDVSSGEGSVVVSGLQHAEEAWLAVSAVDDLDRSTERWDYELRVVALSDDVEEPPAVTTCGCSSQGGRLGSLSGLLLVAIVRRRERSTSGSRRRLRA